jgi:ribose transport system substrate-binding protein
VVRVVDIAGKPRVAFATVTDILASQRDQVDAFVCLEALAGREVAAAINDQHAQNKVVIAMDTDPDTLEWIRKGVIAATIAQKPYTMTKIGLRMLDDLHHYPPPHLDAPWSKDSFARVPTFVDTGSSLVDKSNVDAFTAHR